MKTIKQIIETDNLNIKGRVPTRDSVGQGSPRSGIGQYKPTSTTAPNYIGNFRTGNSFHDGDPAVKPILWRLQNVFKNSEMPWYQIVSLVRIGIR